MALLTVESASHLLQGTLHRELLWTSVCKDEEGGSGVSNNDSQKLVPAASLSGKTSFCGYVRGRSEMLSC